MAVLAIYLELSLPIHDDVFIPHIFGLFLACALAPAVRSWKRVALALVLLGIFCAFNLATTTFGVVSVVKKLKSVVYFVYLFGIAVVIMGAGHIWREKQARRITAIIFLTAGLAMLSFGAVEQMTGLRDISDRFRNVAYGELNADNESRDLELLDKVRPKAFAKETSFASRGVSVLLLIGALTSTGLAPRLLALAGVGAATAVFGSPIPAGFLVAMLYGISMPRRIQSRRAICLYFIALAAVAALSLGVAWMFSPVLQRRVELLTDLSDPSTYMRSGFMYEVAGKALAWNPVSGVGIGGEDELSSEFVLPLLGHVSTNTLINNAMWSIPFFTGLFGSFIAIVLLLAMALRVEFRHSAVFVLTILLILNSTGSIHSSSVWLVGALLFALLRAEQAPKGQRILLRKTGEVRRVKPKSPRPEPAPACLTEGSPSNA
ncbi:MAG: hypothetical protein P4L99_15125 [Chthoniobacter sp.]|nr:hypothetical protein [Chthoniobacter sp.]